MYESLIPWWFQLFAIPIWGTPLYLVVWTVVKARASEKKQALRAFPAAGLWLAGTIAFFVLSFLLEPCLENCRRYRTPEGNARMGALMLLYTASMALILIRLHRRKT
jgi:hypothetical protein